MKERSQPLCASCDVSPEKRACMNREGIGPKACPTLGRKSDVQKVKREYRKKEIAEFARLASIQEAECYAGRERKPYVMHPVKPRMLIL